MQIHTKQFHLAHSVRKQLLPVVTSTINRQKYFLYPWIRICDDNNLKLFTLYKRCLNNAQKLQNTKEYRKVCQLPTELDHNEQVNAVKFWSVSVNKASFADENTCVDVGEKRV